MGLGEPRLVEYAALPLQHAEASLLKQIAECTWRAHNLPLLLPAAGRRRERGSSCPRRPAHCGGLQGRSAAGVCPTQRRTGGRI